MRIKKKIFAMLMMLCMVLQMLPNTVLAETMEIIIVILAKKELVAVVEPQLVRTKQSVRFVKSHMEKKIQPTMWEAKRFEIRKQQPVPRMVTQVIPTVRAVTQSCQVENQSQHQDIRMTTKTIVVMYVEQR